MSTGSGGRPTLSGSELRPAAGTVVEASLSQAPLSVDRLLDAVRRPDVGGIALFIGVVRNHDQGADVQSLDYSQHPSAEQLLGETAARTAEAYDVLTVAVQHRIGHLQVGDLAVVIAVGAVHRGDALAACAFLIDTVKETVPIWKEQAFTSGAAQWVGLEDEPPPSGTGTGADR